MVPIVNSQVNVIITEKVSSPLNVGIYTTRKKYTQTKTTLSGGLLGTSDSGTGMWIVSLTFFRLVCEARGEPPPDVFWTRESNNKIKSEQICL